MNDLALSFNEVAQLVSASKPTQTFMIEGETGIGKSSIAHIIAENRSKATGLKYDVYILDCTQADVGDVLLPMPAEIRGLMQTQYAPNAAFGIGSANPVIIMLDEMGKAMKPVKDALLPLLLEGRIGSYRIPEGSQVIGTSNLAEEGLGDSFEAHARNRMTVIEMRKPTHTEWIDYATKSNLVVGEVIAFANQFPSVFESYRSEGAKTNNYIHDPAHPERTAFVTPRSLVALSDLVAVRDAIPHKSLLTAMVGTVGESAARDMLTMLTLADGLPSRESVHADPAGAKVPKQAVAQLIFGINLVRGADIKSASAVITYVQRLESEIQSVLIMNMVTNADRMGVFSLSPDFAMMAAKTNKYMSV